MKKELRKKFIIERNNLTEGYRNNASAEILSKLENNELFMSAEKVFIFVGFDSEIPTLEFINKWISKKQIFAPKIDNKIMNLVHITSIDDLTPGHFGILEPTSDNYYNGNIDLVITPSIVFDKNGYRLGYGKGYYDKFFATNKHKASIGLSYDTLLQEKVPTNQYDKKVDIIITEEQTLIINEKYNSND